jgi:hypothetical protein
LRRTRAHILQGTRPSRKATDVKDVKRYLNVATVASDGLLLRVSPPAPRIAHHYANCLILWNNIKIFTPPPPPTPLALPSQQM